MKIFENRSIFKKILMILVVVIISGFCFSGKVEAKDDTGGKLLSPIVDLIVFLGDGAMDIMHGVIFQHYDSTIRIGLSSTWTSIFNILVGIVTAVVVGAAVIFTAGAVAAAATAIGLSLSTIGVGTVLLISVTGGIAGAAVFNSKVLPDTIYMPVYQISPEAIFSNEILLFDVDFFNPKERQAMKDSEGNDLKDSQGNVVYMESTAYELRKTISNWYNILRDIALVALLSILVYIGIRIVISSTASDKAKYKQILLDWIVAICLLFVMQYIMAFANLIVGKITQVVSSVKYDKGYFSLIEDEDGKIEDTLTEMGYDIGSIKIVEDGRTYINWKTNLLGVARLNAQMAKKENTTYAGYALIFLVLVIFTIYFVFTYLKRILYMAFLTVIAPLVAMTYPIDKMNDGKAQAFNMWLKEYIFNLLIQPLHLILFVILVSSAFELASTNILYSLVALGFIIPAEKLLRKFFGFEKAQTPGLLAGPAGAALMMSGMNKLIGRGSKGSKKSGGDKNKDDDSDDDEKLRTNSNFDKYGSVFGNTSGPLGEQHNENADDGHQEQENPNDVRTEDDNRHGYSEEEMNDINGSLGLSEDEGYSRPYSDEELDTIYGGYDDEEQDTSNSDTARTVDTNTDNDNTDDAEDTEEDIIRQIFSDDDDYINGINQTHSEQNDSDDIGTSSSDSDNDSRTKRKRGILRNATRAGRASTRYMARGMKRQVKNRIKNLHPIKGAAKMVGGAAAGAALGAAGLAIGITSGDFSKAAQYTTVGAVGGYKMGSGTVGRISDIATPKDVKQEMKRSLYETDEEYEESKRQKYIKNFKKDEKNIFELERKYDKKEAQRIMKEDVPKFIDNGVTDIKDITTIEDLLKDNKIRNINEGISLKKSASRIGEDSTKLSSKKKQEWEKTFATEMAKKDAFRGRNTEQLAKQYMDMIDQYNKIKFK